MTSELAPPAALTRRGIPIDPTLRILALGTLVNRASGGAVFTTFALYFTRHVGLRPAQVGLALSIAAAAGAVAQVPGGHLGDVRGPREVMRELTVLTGVATAGLVLAHSFWALVVVASLVTASQMAANSVRNGYIARIAVGGQGVRFKAYLRAVTNIAMTFGALVGGIALWIDRPWAFVAVFLLDAATSVATGLLFHRLPQLPAAPARAEGEPRLGVVRDLPYVAVTLLTSVVFMHFVVLEIGIPLWISEHTTAPTAMVAILLGVNTVAVALFQVRLSRGADSVTSGASAVARGGAWIAAAFVLIGLTDGVARAVAVPLLLLAGCVHVVGEMVSSSGQWGVAMGLAPVERQGVYQGFGGLAFSLSRVAAPTLITTLCIGWGRPGWFVLGGLILLAAVLMKPVSAWGLATREKYGAATASG
ncbi:MAG TPA: MFS transporter [Marmoricola sp.]|nr:MFS transporter [Marmoricola sp.]